MEKVQSGPLHIVHKLKDSCNWIKGDEGFHSGRVKEETSLSTSVLPVWTWLNFAKWTQCYQCLLPLKKFHTSYTEREYRLFTNYDTKTSRWQIQAKVLQMKLLGSIQNLYDDTETNLVSPRLIMEKNDKFQRFWPYSAICIQWPQTSNFHLPQTEHNQHLHYLKEHQIRQHTEKCQVNCQVLH